MRYSKMKLAELVACCGRLNGATETSLLGIERAIAEIVYVAQSDLLRRMEEAANRLPPGQDQVPRRVADRLAL